MKTLVALACKKSWEVVDCKKAWKAVAYMLA